MLIKANIDDLDEVISLYDEVLADKDNLKFSNWERGIYPTEEFAADAITNGSLFFFAEEGVIKGGVVLDSRQPEDYNKIQWTISAPDDRVLVVHAVSKPIVYSVHAISRSIVPGKPMVLIPFLASACAPR